MSNNFGNNFDLFPSSNSVTSWKKPGMQVHSLIDFDEAKYYFSSLKSSCLVNILPLAILEPTISLKELSQDQE